MARNSIESTLYVSAPAQVHRLDGVLVARNATHTVFKSRKSGGRRMIEKSYANERVIAYGDDKLVVLLDGRIGRKQVGTVNHTDKGIVLDGLTYNPKFVEVEADYGTEDAAPAAKAKRAPEGKPRPKTR
jgi:hypothetical protein